MSDVDRAAVGRWRDPSLHGASELLLEYVVGAYRAAAGDHAAAEPLLRFARQAVPPVSVWRLDTTWLLLRSRRHLHDAPSREDIDLCREMIRVGEFARSLRRRREPGLAAVPRAGVRPSAATRHVRIRAALSKTRSTYFAGVEIPSRAVPFFTM